MASRRILRSRAAYALVAAAVAHAPRAHANPMDAFGFGSRGAGLGNAVSADATDPSANYYNPAGLARSKALEVDIAYMHASHFLRLNDKDTAVDDVGGLVVGLGTGGKIGGIPVGFGLGVHLPDARLSRVRALRQEQPRWELYDNRNQRIYLAANVAVAPLSWLELGGGFSFMSSTQGRLDITGYANILDPGSSQLRHEVDASLSTIRYPQVGARFKIAKGVHLALVYRGEFQLDLELKARLQGDVSGLTTVFYSLETTSVNAFLPQQIVIGASWELSRRVKVNYDLTWIDWSAYVSPVAKLAVALDIPPPAGGWPASITPPSLPAPIRIVPLRLRDRIVPHLGVEWLAMETARCDLRARAGYEFSASPIPAQTGPTNFMDRDRHAFALGAGVRYRPKTRTLPKELRFDANVGLSILPEGTIQKRDPADYVGDVTAGGSIFQFGLSVGGGFE